MQTQLSPTTTDKTPIRGIAQGTVTVTYQAALVIVRNTGVSYERSVMGRATVPVQGMATHLDAIIADQHPGLELVDWWVVE